MKITHTIRQKGTNGLMGLTDNNKMIKISFYQGSYSLSFGSIFIKEIYLKNEDFEPISIHTFKRALRLVKHRLNNQISELCN